MWTCISKCFSFSLRHCVQKTPVKLLMCCYYIEVKPYGQRWGSCHMHGDRGGEREETCQKASLLAPKRPPGEHLAFSLTGSETRFFRSQRVILIFRGMSPVKLSKLIQSIRKLVCGSARKLVPTHLWGHGGGLEIFYMGTGVLGGGLVSMDPEQVE